MPALKNDIQIASLCLTDKTLFVVALHHFFILKLYLKGKPILCCVRIWPIAFCLSSLKIQMVNNGAEWDFFFFLSHNVDNYWKVKYHMLYWQLGHWKKMKCCLPVTCLLQCIKYATRSCEVLYLILWQQWRLIMFHWWGTPCHVYNTVRAKILQTFFFFA